MERKIWTRAPLAATENDLLGSGSSTLPPLDFGVRASNRAEDCGLLTPLPSYTPHAIELALPFGKRFGTITHFLADHLQRALGVSVEDVAQAIEHYAALGLYDAADRAAGEDPILRQRVEDAFSLPRSHFLAQYGDLLDDAKAASDPEIDEYLAVVRTELDRRNLSEAAAWVDVLRDLVVRHRRRADPERNALVA